MARVSSTQNRRDDEENNTETTRNNRESKKRKVMGDSSQTDEERRKLRLEQRVLKQEILSGKGDSIEDPESNAFDMIRNRNNELFKKVSFNREGVLDGENLDLISEKAKKQANQSMKLPAYDAIRVAQSIRRIGTSSANGTFDWEEFGKGVGLCFNAPPVASFFNGPIDSIFVAKERKKHKTRVRNTDNDEEEKLDEEKNDKSCDADKLSAVEKHMKDINKALNKKYTKKIKQVELDLKQDESLSQSEKDAKLKQAHLEGICAIKFLFNPNSFTQTVENIFHFSFTIKKGDSGIQVVKGKDGVLRPTVRKCSTKEENPPAKQTIVSLDMKQWKKICKRYGVTKCDIPHRTGSRFTQNEKD